MGNSRFDELIDRSATHSYKWGPGCGTAPEECIPMWVADMDFACPEPIVAAVQARAAHPIYGYTAHGPGYTECVAGWMNRRYGYQPELSSITFAPPGVLYAVYTMLRLLTGAGDKVVVLMPNYDPLYQVVSESGRVLVESELILAGGKVSINFDDLDQKLAGAKLLLLSHPHNPTGRVWTMGELEAMAQLCEKHGVYVISDEIHADFVSKRLGHIPFPAVGPAAAKNCMACYSANKGFNLGGLQTATLLIADEEKRAAFEKEMALGQTRLDTIFGIEATRAAYSQPECESWLDEAIDYVDSNKRLVYGYLGENVPGITAVPSEGTYLVWLDCRGLGLGPEELQRFFVQRARVQVCMGADFGKSGQQFVRLNLACPRAIVQQALERIEKAAKEIKED